MRWEGLLHGLRLDNDGKASVTLIVKGTGGGVAWVVTYWDAVTGGTDITSQVTGSKGWSVALAAGVKKFFRVNADHSGPPDAFRGSGGRNAATILRRRLTTTEPSTPRREWCGSTWSHR